MSKNNDNNKIKNTHAKVKLIIITIIVALGICLSVIPFDIPTTSDKFLSFIGAMSTSAEVNNSSSYKITFTIDKTDGEVENSKVKDGIKELYDILNDYMYEYNDIKIVRAYEEGEEKLIAYVATSTLTTNFFDLFSESKTFEAKKGSEVVINNDNIESAQYTQYSGNYGVYISLDKKGTSALIKYEDTLTYNIGDSSVKGVVLNNALFLYSTETATDTSTASKASTMAVSLMMGKLPFKVSVKTTTIDALAGSNVATILKVVTAIVALLYVVYVLVSHKMLGLVNILSAGIFFVLDCFIIQSVPVASLQLTSYLAIIVSFILYVIANEYQISKMKEQAEHGKKLEYCIKAGYKNSLLTLMDLHFITFIVSICTLIMGDMTTKAFSINMIIGIVISALLMFVVNKFLTNLMEKSFVAEKKNCKFNFPEEQKRTRALAKEEE